MSLNPYPVIPKHGSAARWATVNLVLGVGEVGFETDTRKEKRGDGVSAWNDLPYVSDPYVMAKATSAAIAAGGTTTIDAGTYAMVEYGVATASALTFAIANGPGATRTMDLTVVVFNNTAAPLGAITWPATFLFTDGAWVNPAAQKRRHLTARWAPSLGKWLCRVNSGGDY